VAPFIIEECLAEIKDFTNTPLVLSKILTLYFILQPMDSMEQSEVKTLLIYTRFFLMKDVNKTSLIYLISLHL
jgi:hypothetical protein